MNIDKDIKILEKFKNNELERDKLERNPKGGFKIGDIYKFTKLNPAIENVLSELETYKKAYELETYERQKFIDELETYKKIVNKLACYMWKYDCCQYEIGKNGQCKGFYLESDCKQCIIDWARKEVEKDE